MDKPGEAEPVKIRTLHSWTQITRKAYGGRGWLIGLRVSLLWSLSHPVTFLPPFLLALFYLENMDQVYQNVTHLQPQTKLNQCIVTQRQLGCLN